MIFNNTIKHFNLEEVQKAYAKGDYMIFAPLMDSLVTRNLPLKSTCLDRRLIHYWETRKLFNDVVDSPPNSFIHKIVSGMPYIVDNTLKLSGVPFFLSK